MPSKYSDQQKREALQMLEIGDHIGYVHYATGIPERTLRRWRQELPEQPNGQMAEKTLPADTDRRPTEETDANETAEPPNTDIEDFTYIREQLMKYARQMAADLRPNEPDSNRRTLALARILDRIQWLDQILPGRIPEQTIRWEHYYDGVVQEHPPWHDASDDAS